MIKPMKEKDVLTAASVIADKHMTGLKIEDIKEAMASTMLEYADLRERKTELATCNMLHVLNFTTKEEILKKNGFYFEAFKAENEYSAKNLLAAMDEYSEQNCDHIQKLFTRPTRELKPLEDLYRKENPHPKGIEAQNVLIENRGAFGIYYIPDTTKFYKWITSKIIGK